MPDEPAAVAAAKRYLSYFAGDATRHRAAQNRNALRDLIPANRKRVYDIRTVIDALLDDVLELRRGFGAGIVTALARANDGRPLGVIANNPAHLGGAIDADGADKAARFMQLCDAFGLPLLFLCDTPGFMVGPEAEKTATVRHFSRMFLTGANLERADRHDRAPQGLRPRRAGDGRRRLQGAAVHGRVADGRVRRDGARGRGPARDAPRARGDRRTRPNATQAFDKAVAAAYERGKGLNMAAYFEIDDVIDPADSRRWIATLFDDDARGHWRARQTKRRPYVDAW